MPGHCSAFRAAILAAVTFPAWGGAAHAGDVHILFDGSGSMWGVLPGGKETKFAAAREALRQSLPRLPGDTRVALSSFGHRRKGDCNDVEQIVPAEKFALDRIMTPLDKLNPKGKGPLVQALREAAKSAAPDQETHVILVHDGADNCQQDPCAAAAELAKQNGKLRVHTIGLALENDDGPKMACLAKLTGGRQFDAPNAAAASAVIGEAIALVMQRQPAAPAPAAKAQPNLADLVTPPPTTTAPATDGPSRIRLSAQLGADKAVLAEPIEWRVVNGNGEAVVTVAAAQVEQPLAAGRYSVEARLGRLRMEQKLDVAAKGETLLRVSFNAGLVTLAARPYKEATPFQDIVWSIVPDSGTSGSVVTRDSTVSVVLPAGTYKVTAERGRAVTQQTVKVEAGGRQALDMLLSSGDLEVSAAGSDENDAITGATFIVAEDDPEAPQGRREIARSAAPKPLFRLPAGTYYITAKHGFAETRQRLAVGAGDVVKRTLVLGTTRVQVETQLQRPLEAQSALVKVFRVEGDGMREVGQSRSIPAEFVLPHGRYRIEATAGGHNVRSERTLDVKGGKPVQVALAFAAGQVVLKPVGTGFAETFWEVRDAQGKLVLRSAQSEAKALLAPGRYTARLESRDSQAERSFELRPGEVLPLEIKVE